MPPTHTSISFDLLEFTTPEELTHIVESFCKITKVAGGIVRMPQPGFPTPQTERELHRFRLTRPEVINPSRFCGMIRSCTEGNMSCMRSDLEHAQSANSNGSALPYPCHMGITDLMAPIRVGGRHVANVYLGQIRSPQVKFEEVKERYKLLLEKSGRDPIEADSDAFKRAFDDLPQVAPQQLPDFSFFVETLANLISQRANRQAVTKLTVAAARDAGVTLNLRAGLSVYLRYAMALVNGDTGSIFLLDPENQNKLVGHALTWRNDSDVEISFKLNGQGIISNTARRNLEHIRNTSSNQQSIAFSSTEIQTSRFNTRAEMDDYCNEQLGGNRDRRGLESLIVVPIYCGSDFLGTLDIGSRKQFAFESDDDQHVLLLFAAVVGVYVRNVRERQRLVRLFGKRNAIDMARNFADEISREVQGMGCSIFFLKSRNLVELVASTEFPPSIDFSKITYQSGEGLTGGCFKLCDVVRIPASPNTRTTNLPPYLKSANISWKAKFSELELQECPHYKDRPFLAVPIKNPDGIPCGVIRISDRHDGDFTEQDIRNVQVYSDLLGHFLRFPLSILGRSSFARKPRIFIGHGHDHNVLGVLENYLQAQQCDVVKYTDNVHMSEYSYQVVEEMIKRSDAAIIVFTGDDKLHGGESIARRNVVHELGLAQGILGAGNTLILRSEGVELPTNVSGMHYVSFQPNNIAASFHQLHHVLRQAGILP